MGEAGVEETWRAVCGVNCQDSKKMLHFGNPSLPVALPSTPFPPSLPLDAPSQTHHGIDARAKKDGRNDPKRDDVTEGFRPKVGSRAVAPVRFFVDEDGPFLDKKFQGRDVAGWRERVREGRG